MRALMTLLIVTVFVPAGAQAMPAMQQTPAEEALADRLDRQLLVQQSTPLVSERQDTQVTETLERPARLDVSKIQLSKALVQLGEASGVPLIFSPSFMPEVRVSCDCASLSIREALTVMLQGTELDFLVHGPQVIVAPSNEPVRAAPMGPAPEALALRPTASPIVPTASRVASSAPTPILRVRQGTITGQVTDRDTNQALSTVQISVEGTGLGTITNAEGEFTVSNVPAGTHTVLAQRIGYAQNRQDVTVTSGQTSNVDFILSPTVLALQEVVATGLADPVEGVRSPIAVGRVSRERMPITVASGPAVENLQGMVAGVRMNRTTGQPGDDVTMMLRSPTTLRGGGAPLIVVDGVVLSGTGVPATVDIDGMDIESIEVVRGAAASSLYGSRAAAGVIQITTSRGQGLDIGQTRFTARTEYGISDNVRNVRLNNSHAFLMDDARTTYVDEAGNPVSRNDRVLPPMDIAFLDNPYPDPIYDNLSSVLERGRFLSNHFSVSGNTADTNFAISLSNLNEEGSLVGNDGYERTSFRINVDHRFMDALSLGVSMYHSRDQRDELFGTGASDPVNAILYAPRDVDLIRRDEDGSFIQQPDPNVIYQNPVWTETSREFDREGTRTLGNINLSWAPRSWFSTSAALGYDRGDRSDRRYVPKGTPLSVGQAGVEDGSIRFRNWLDEAINTEAQMTLRRDLGPLNVRTTVRALMERSSENFGLREGSNFILAGIPQVDNIRVEDRTASSDEMEIRATGYLWDTALDYEGKYILTVLGRRDGSSLFGEDNRWHNYYRVAGAWRIGQEEWFNVPNVSEFRISLARGTAGGRPEFSWQYETWSLQQGIPTKGSLGNRQLRPEHTLEHEMSMNLILFDRIGVTLTHARQNTSDQLNPVPMPGITGYSTQWQNAGTISGHSTEFELEAQWIQTAQRGWSSVLIADYSNAHISEWDIPCYAQGWRWNCIDIPVYGLYSRWLVNSRAGLNQHDNGSAVPYADEFQVNDEGFLVWVGEHNYWEGMEKGLWGTEGEVGGRTYKWGHPFYELTEQGLPHRTLLGEGVSSNFGLINNVRFGGLSLHAALHASVGGQTNNRRHQFMANTDRATAPRMDQAGKPEGLKKPIAYFRSAIDGDNSYTIEDSSYLKLRTLSVAYDMGQAQLNRFGLGDVGIQNLRLGLVARNVFTITNYDGWDPESGLNLNTRSNSDTAGYPPVRNLTAEISVTF